MRSVLLLFAVTLRNTNTYRQEPWSLSSKFILWSGFTGNTSRKCFPQIIRFRPLRLSSACTNLTHFCNQIYNFKSYQLSILQQNHYCPYWPKCWAQAHTICSPQIFHQVTGFLLYLTLLVFFPYSHFPHCYKSKTPLLLPKMTVREHNTWNHNELMLLMLYGLIHTYS